MSDSHFYKAVDEVWSGKNLQPRGTVISLKKISKKFGVIGIPDLPLVINYDKFISIKKQHREITLKILKQIPQQINDPVAIFKSSTTAKAFIVLTELKGKNNKPVVVAIHINRKWGKIKVNRLASVYGRDLSQIKTAIKKNIVYYNKEKLKGFLVFHLVRPGTQLTMMFSDLDKKSGLGSILTNKNIKNKVFLTKT